jgi:hypothetical protein
MTSLKNRQTYLGSDYTPGEVSELLKGERYTSFGDLPYSFGDLSGKDQPTYTSVGFDRLSKFKSEQKDPGSMFQRFLALQNNPTSLVESKMRLPTGFNQAYNLSASASS